MGEIIFALFHPTARPSEWMRACRRFHDTAEHPENCEYILGIHRRQNELPEAALDFADYYHFAQERLSDIWGSKNSIVAVNLAEPNVINNSNCAAAHTSGKVLIAVGDYLRPSEGWDTELLKVIPDLDNPYLVSVSHGSYLPDTWIVTYSILTRALYEQRGYVAWPEYLHYGIDDDFTLMAQRDGMIIEAKHIVWPYLHWSNGKRQLDALDRQRHEQSEAWKIRERVLEERQALNFAGKVSYGWRVEKDPSVA